MPDVWTTVRDLDDATQERLAGVLEKRGADAQQRAMRRAFLAEVTFPGGSVTDRRIMRRLANVVVARGFRLDSFRSFGFAEFADDGYMLTIVDRGADILRNQGHITADTAAALKAEARSRLQERRFFGHIAYAGLVAGKP